MAGPGPQNQSQNTELATSPLLGRSEQGLDKGLTRRGSALLS